MRILWFSIIPLLDPIRGVTHNGGGWISSLEKIVRKNEEIELGIAFNLPTSAGKHQVDGVVYYCITPYRPNIIEKITHKIPENLIVRPYLQVVEDFQPDLIQIFGSESDFGLISLYTSIPVVIHLQGSLPPYGNALFPIGMNQYDFLFTGGLPLRKRLMGLLSSSSFKRKSEREIKIIQSCMYFMGRTDWDKALVDLFNPNCCYYHCEEAIRDSFLQAKNLWEWRERKEQLIVSVISQPWYKGVDLILKTAQLLKRFTNLDFRWHIYGIKDISFYEHKYAIHASDVNVYTQGVASKDELAATLMKASCFVHPSYIENSPNSICEAQLIGTPVIATFVGGVPSLLDYGKYGILIPANAPFTLASKIKHLVLNKELSLALSSRERQFALNRHEPDKINKELLCIYHDILQRHKDLA